MVSPQRLEQYEIDKITRMHFSTLQLSKVDDIVNRLHTKLLEKVVDFDVNSQKKHLCFDHLGIRSTQYAMSYRPSLKKTVKKSAKTNDKSTNSARANRIADAKKLFGDNDIIEAHLGKGQGFESKQDVSQFRRMQLTELVNDKRLNPPSSSVLPQDKLLMKDIIQLANDGKWQEAVAKLKQIDMPDDEMASTLLTIALYAQVDFSIMEDLLNSGAKVPPNAIKWLIVKDNVTLARQLLPYGLNLNYAFMGDSTLAMSVKRRKFNMLKFLIQNNVPMDSNTPGFDALDHAIKQLNLKVDGVIYIDALIKAGASIELSHKQTVDSMKLRDMVAYYKLTSTWAELKL